MKFKTIEVETRFKDMCSMAQTIAIEICSYVKDKYQIDLVITATVSSAEEDH